MTKEEAQDEEDILIMSMIKVRDERIKLLENENRDLKKLLLEINQENESLKKINKGLKSKWYRREEWDYLRKNTEKLKVV